VVLAIIFIVDLPFSSLCLVGYFIGVGEPLFDGTALHTLEEK